MGRPAHPDYEGLQAVPFNESNGMMENSAPELIPEDRPIVRKTAYSIEGLQAVHQSLDSEFEYPITKDMYPTLPTKPGLSGKRAIAAVVMLIMLAVGIVLPAAVALSMRLSQAALQRLEQPHMDDRGKNTTQPNNISTRGAFSGSGLSALAPLKSSEGAVLVFFQHFTGGLRQLNLNEEGWTGGTSDDTIASTNVKNGTPIGSTAYPRGSDEVWHVVWIDENNILQDATQINASGTWEPGSLSAANLEASSSPNVGLSISPLYTLDKSTNVTRVDAVRIYFGGANGTVHEASLIFNTTDWRETHYFAASVSGDAGLAAVASAGLTILFYVDGRNNTLSYCWQDHISNATEATSASSAGWTDAPNNAAVALRPNTSLAFTADNFLIYQDPSNNIISIDPNLGSLSRPWGATQTVGKAINGTHIASMTVIEPIVWAQADGDDVTEYTDTGKGPPWAAVQMPIN